MKKFNVLNNIDPVMGTANF